ncbi:hypothetical protein ACM26V_00210 [Salipaludibacillus sp. HK11]|uniref:hypothetical protein n=1 Tax=Salipaludibacillus sp. HK11 TaxID=3394320 RepID=UPI0039FC3AB3
MEFKDLPIDPEILKKRMQIPKLLAKLSYQDEEEAIRLMRQWGEKKQPITSMYNELIDIVEPEKVS